MPSIRYTSSYERLTKAEGLMKVRSNHSSLQKKGCSRNDCSRCRAAASSVPRAARSCVQLLLLLPSTAAAGELEISAQEAMEGTRQLLKQWELAALAPSNCSMAQPSLPLTKPGRPPSAEKWHLRQRMEKKEAETSGLDLTGSTGT